MRSHCKIIEVKELTTTHLDCIYLDQRPDWKSIHSCNKQEVKK